MFLYYLFVTYHNVKFMLFCVLSLEISTLLTFEWLQSYVL